MANQDDMKTADAAVAAVEESIQEANDLVEMLEHTIEKAAAKGKAMAQRGHRSVDYYYGIERLARYLLEGGSFPISGPVKDCGNTLHELTQEEADTLMSVVRGADIYSRSTAGILRGLEKIGLVDITKPMMYRGDGTDEVPLFGAIATNSGKAALRDFIFDIK